MESFARWIQRCDELLSGTGFILKSWPDVVWDDLFEQGQSPEDAVQAALESEA